MEGLRSLLESVEGLRLAAAETSLAGGMHAVRELQPAVLVVDKSFGIQAVMECLRTLRDAECRTAAVVWSVALSEAEALRLLQAGAAGVVHKNRPAGDAAGMHPAGGGRKHLDGGRTDCHAGPAGAHGPPGAHGAGTAVMELVELGQRTKISPSRWASGPARSRFTSTHFREDRHPRPGTVWRFPG